MTWGNRAFFQSAIACFTFVQFFSIFVIFFSYLYAYVHAGGDALAISLKFALIFDSV